MRRLHAKLFGRVQGVGFRFFALRQANALGLTGTVRNVYVPRRYVEVIAEGPEPALKQFLDVLRRGPSAAYVDRVETNWSAATNEFSTFRIL